MSSSQPPEESSGRITLKDVARKVGVSHVTVSVALRDRAGVSVELKERIKRTAAEMGYVPEPMARALAVYRHNKRHVPIHSALAWVNFWPNSKLLRSFAEFDQYWEGAREAAQNAGYHLEEFLPPGPGGGRRLANILRARGIRGVIIPPHNVQVDWTGFDWEHFAIVKLGHSQINPLSYSAAPDQVGNAFLAWDHSKAAGYQRIGYVGCLNRVRKWWFAGALLMENALESSRLRVPPLFLDGSYSDPEFFTNQTTRRLLENWIKRHRPEVIICETGDLRITVEKLGLSVPGDLAMVNLSVNRGTLIETGIYQNPTLIGKAATDTLIGLINRSEWGETAQGHTVTVMGSWREGDTMPIRA